VFWQCEKNRREIIWEEEGDLQERGGEQERANVANVIKICYIFEKLIMRPIILYNIY
jgi:hypothetical protein